VQLLLSGHSHRGLPSYVASDSFKSCDDVLIQSGDQWVKGQLPTYLGTLPT